MITITASVGQDGVNRNSDVLNIQKALNKIPANKGGATPALKEDGLIGPKTIGAIMKFQKSNQNLVLDGRVDSNGATLARINTVIGLGPKFTDKNLYGPGGPSANDIKQDAFGDCYFVATLGAVAQQNPVMIRSAILYDRTKQQFRVRLYDLKGQIQLIWVTQTELQDNVNRHGGSYVDNTGKYQRTWPAVIETAYAKMFDSNPADGLGQGYQKIVHGGWPSDAMMAVTGSTGRKISYVYYNKLGTKGSIVLLGARVSTALSKKKSVTLWVVPEKDTRGLWGRLIGAPIAQDGLVDNHVYTVLSMALNGPDWNVTVRNPWGTNMGVGEGRNIANSVMTVSLKTLVITGGLKSFQVSR